MKNNNDENILTEASCAATQKTLSQAFLTFVKETEEAVTPETFDPKARWAVEHDNNSIHHYTMNDYNMHTVLNTDNLDKLNDDYAFLMSKEGSAQQVLRLMEEAIPTNQDEVGVKNRTIAYINKWFELMSIFYDTFLYGLVLDKEPFEDKYTRVRSELISQTNKTIINDYVDYMKEHEEWDDEDVERFLAGDDPFVEIPESFSQSYYADLDLLD